MSVELNHTIIPAQDRRQSARFLAGILGVEVGREWAHFVPVRMANGVTLDFAEATNIRPNHYAFLLDETAFDQAFARLKQSGAKFYAEFDGTGIGEINRLYGGRSVYFEDPSGHTMEMITRPYGATPELWIDGKAVAYTR